MSAAPFNPKRFLLTVSGDLVNVDYVMRIYVNAGGQLFADMQVGPDVELAATADQIKDLRRSLPLNSEVT